MKELPAYAFIGATLLSVAKSKKKHTKSNPTFDELKDRIEYYTGQVPDVEDGVYIIAYKTPKQPVFMFQNLDQFVEGLENHLIREGFDVSIEINDDFIVIFYNGEIKIKQTVVDSLAKKALDVLNKKSKFMTDYTSGVIHKNHPALFVYNVYFDDDSKIVYLLLNRGNRDAIVFDPKNTKGYETVLSEKINLDLLRQQEMRGRDLNKEPLFIKYGLKAVMQGNRVNNNQGARANKDFMVMGIRRSFSNYYTLLILMRDKTFIQLEWDKIAKRVAHYEMKKI